MAQYPVHPSERSLIDAICRDLVIAGLSVGICMALNAWHAAGASMLSLVVGSVLSFIVAYLGIYLLHEWGHYIGARLGGADIPFGPANSVLLGLFDNAAHTRRQFQFMALGGEAGYLIPAVFMIGIFWNWPPLQGIAVAAAAFVLQSLYVDVPILWRIHKGADIQNTLDAGLAPKVLLSKTAISWAAVAAGIGAATLAG